jgi:DNA polymerase
MDVITIDFETYYDKEYSLSKMTTEAYVRDPRFEVIGVGIKINDYPVDWYSGSDPGRFLRSLDYSKAAILCHNTVFDGAILSWHFNIRPKLWLDTLSMARPLHNIAVGGSLKALAAHYKLGEKGDEVVHTLGKRRTDFTKDELDRYANYCCNDVDLTYKLFRRMAKGFPPSEIRLIDQTIRMFTEPSIVLDTQVLTDHLVEVQEKKSTLMDELELPYGTTEDEAKSMLMSNDKFAAYLVANGVTPPTKTSAATGKQAYAFSKTTKAFTDLLEHDNPRVASAVAARLGVKSTLEETRTKSLLGVAERGPLPILLKFYGAHTGRFCVVGDTEIIVLRDDAVLCIPITDLLPDDLVWDGLEFVTHGGLVDQGEREVMTYGGITGTPDHRVFCDEVSEAVELRVAAERGYTLTVARPPE